MRALYMGPHVWYTERIGKAPTATEGKSMIRIQVPRKPHRPAPQPIDARTPSGKPMPF